MPSINETPYNFSCVCRPFFYGCPLQQRILSQKCPAVGGNDNEDKGVTPQSNEVSVMFGLRIHLQLFLQEINLLCLAQVEGSDAMMIFRNKNSFNKWLGTRWKSEKMEVFSLTPHDERSENGERPENKSYPPKPHVSEQPGVMLLAYPSIRPHAFFGNERQRILSKGLWDATCLAEPLKQLYRKDCSYQATSFTTEKCYPPKFNSSPLKNSWLEDYFPIGAR